MTTFMEKYNRAVQQSKLLKKQLDLPDHIIDSILNTQERINNNEVEPIEGGYKTGNGFLRLVDNEEDNSKEEEIQQVAEIIPIRKRRRPNKDKDTI